MKKFISLLSLIVFLLALGACGNSEPPQDASTGTEAIDPAEVIADIEEDQVDLANIGVAWPADVPAEVPVLEGATITYVQEGANARTIMFEGIDQAGMKGYIESLAASGFTQNSFSENDFGLNYTGGKDSITIFINFVASDISKLDIRY